MNTKDLIHAYYRAWASRDKEGARARLADNLHFVSPQDQFKTAYDFLAACWKYSDGLSDVEFVKEVYEGDQAFVVLRWKMEDGSSFADAEYVCVADGKLARIIVVNNDPAFEVLLD